MLRLAVAALVKVITFAWCFFPSMTGQYPVVGVSRIQWCDCLTYREEAENMEQDVMDGTRKFMQKQARRGSGASMH